MKKSELVEILSEKFKEYSYEGRFRYFHEYARLAEEIISICEQNGMKPPVKKRCPVLLTDKFEWQDETSNQR